VHHVLELAGGHVVPGGVVVAHAGLEGLLERRNLVGRRDAAGQAVRGRRYATGRESACGRSTGGRALDVLQLGLQVLYRFIQLGNAGLQLVDRVVQRLHLAGDGVQLAVARLALRVDLLLQGVDGRGHLVGVVRGLLHQVLQDAEAAIQVDWSRCTMSSSCCTWVCSSMISFEAACAGTGERRAARQSCRREETIAKCSNFSIFHP
jgi:hypothetical protein